MRILAIVVTAATLLLMEVEASSAATLLKAQAGKILAATLKREGSKAPQCYPLTVNYVSVQGAWAFVSATCRTNPDDVTNAVLHEQNGAWKFACAHGDDVMGANDAAQRCGMTHAQARSLGFAENPH